MYTLCTHHNHHYNSELIQPGQGVTANTYCTLMWCPHTHAHIQIDDHYQIKVNTENITMLYASRAAEWSSDLIYCEILFTSCIGCMATHYTHPVWKVRGTTRAMIDSAEPHPRAPLRAEYLLLARK